MNCLIANYASTGYKWGLRLTNDGLELHVSGYDDGVGDVVAILSRHLQLLLSAGVPAIPAGFVPEERMFAMWKAETMEVNRVCVCVCVCTCCACWSW